MQRFVEFVDRKQRESRRQLRIVKKILERGDFDVKGHFEGDEPFVWVKSNNKKLPFEGVRVYQIGDQIAYRVQNLEGTEPYGRAYPLNIEQMFNDFMGENMSEEKAGERVIKAVVNEIEKFFKKSAEATEEIRTGQKDGVGTIVKTGGTDYSAMVLNRL